MMAGVDARSAERSAIGIALIRQLCAAASAALVLACGTALAAETQRLPPKPPPAIEAIKQRDQELESVRTEQRKATESEQKLTRENDSLMEERRKLNESLLETANRIRKDEEQIATSEIHLRELDSSEAEIRRSLDGRRALIIEVLAALQRIGHRPPPAVFAGTEDAIEAVRTAISLGAVLPEMRNEVRQLTVELADLAQVKKEQETGRTRLTAELTDLGAAQSNMTGLVAERQKRQAELEQAIASERQRVLALSRQADNLKDLIGKLEQGLEGSARNTKPNPRPTEEAKPATEPRSAVAMLHDPARMAPAVAFISAKGKLAMPVSGVRIREFGSSDGMGGNDKGISVTTRSGAQVTAPSDGWVVYAAPYRSYGQLLILNVGGGYHIILAGMERITVDLGQFVLNGEPVAVMGSGTQVALDAAASSAAAGPASPTNSSQPVLYIEFRKDGTPIDSNPWWTATESEKVRG
jgi:murein hydrolase activator